MARSKAETVDRYIAEAAPERVPQLQRLRALIRTTLPEHDERMQWGMPAYVRDGEADIAFASQKQHLAIYVMKAGVIERHAEALAGLDHGKGCIRFRNPEAMEWPLVETLLRETAASAKAQG